MCELSFHMANNRSEQNNFHEKKSPTKCTGDALRTKKWFGRSVPAQTCPIFPARESLYYATPVALQLNYNNLIVWRLVAQVAGRCRCVHVIHTHRHSREHTNACIRLVWRKNKECHTHPSSTAFGCAFSRFVVTLLIFFPHSLVFRI